MAVEVFGNVALAVVATGGTSAPAPGTVETWTVQGLGNFPVVTSPANQLHVADISQNTEIVLVTNMSGAGHLTWTVTRGAESTTPVSHAAGFVIYQVTTAGFLNGAAAAASLAIGSAGQEMAVASTGLPAWVTGLVNVLAYPAAGDGTTDDTTAIQDAFNQAGTLKTGVFLPPAPGGCYRVSNLSVPAGMTGLYGSCLLSRADGPTVTSLAGSVLGPINGSVTTMLTIGASGSGSFVSGNPHGLVVDGIGFLGTTAAGASISGMWAVVITDTSDVTLIRCRDLYCDAPSFSGYPSGGAGTGGWAQVLSSGSGNGFSENARVLFCQSYGAGKVLNVDGISSGNGGSTDGRMMGCQANGHNRGIQLGPTNAGTGGWGIIECHFSSTSGTNHINYGSAGTPWTLRVEGCYFDVINTTPIVCNGRGLQAVGNYFRAGSNVLAISFGSGLTTNGRDPAAVVCDNTFDLNGSTTVTCLAKFGGMTAANVASHGGGEYRDNLVHNHGAVMPGSWVAQFIGSDSAAVTGTTSATLDLAQGPVLSA